MVKILEQPNFAILFSKDFGNENFRSTLRLLLSHLSGVLKWRPITREVTREPLQKRFVKYQFIPKTSRYFSNLMSGIYEM